MRALPLIGGAVLAIAALSTAAGVHYAAPREAHGSHWQEIAWPFPRDGWPAGRAFRCDPASCGAEAELYVRPKIGFCNCTTGVDSDDELERVADVELVSPRYSPLGAGRQIAVGWMNGRSRPYRVASLGPATSALAVAFNERCDVIVATAFSAG